MVKKYKGLNELVLQTVKDRNKDVSGFFPGVLFFEIVRGNLILL